MKPHTEALAGYLDSLDFDNFCTFTTRRPVSVFAARKIAERVGGAVGAGRRTAMFWAAEKFDLREGFHFHALMKFDRGDFITPTAIWAWYYPRYGRCQIIPNTTPEVKQSASYYTAKYITKDLADYDIWLPGMTDPPPQIPLF